MTDGPRDPVLLLHGQPGGASDWDRVRDAIGDRVPTVAIDRPGWNGRAAPSDLEGNVAAALAALDAAGAERAVVVAAQFLRRYWQTRRRQQDAHG